MKSNPYKLRSKKTNIYKNIAKSIKARRKKFGNTQKIQKDKILDADPDTKFYGVRSTNLKNKVLKMKKEHHNHAMRIHEPKKKNILLRILVISLILLPIISTISKRQKEAKKNLLKPPSVLLLYLQINQYHDKKYLLSLIKQTKYMKITKDSSQSHIEVNANKIKTPCSPNLFATIKTKQNGKISKWKVYDRPTPCNKHFVSNKIFDLIKR